MSEHLVQREPRSLADCERVIEQGKQTFMEVGQALLEIRDRRLYLETHATFADYCSERWGFSDRHARRLMAATRYALESGPMGPVPANERQARAAIGSHPSPRKAPAGPFVIIVDQEFCRLLPPLKDYEFAMLERDILRFGCLVPLLVNQDHLLLDGHARLSICQKHGIPYAVNVVQTADRSECICMILEIQLCRKNLSPDQQAIMLAMAGLTLADVMP
jgi:hypothetical protein